MSQIHDRESLPAGTPTYLEQTVPPQTRYSTPRWVKVFGAIAVVLILLAGIILITGVGGPHGPFRHTSSGDAGGNIPPIQHQVQQP